MFIAIFVHLHPMLSLFQEFVKLLHSLILIFALLVLTVVLGTIYQMLGIPP